MFKKLLCVFLLCPFWGMAQNYTLKQLATGKNTSMRGLSVVSDSIAWVSGSNGYVGKTLNGGKTWEWVQPKGYEKLDFRDIEAFDKLKAIVVNAGSPAYVLSTIDGGKTWREVYKNTDSAIFLDGMGFWDAQQGIIFGDPIKNKMQLLKTVDGGLTWQDISAQLKKDLKAGEAGFAASGTTIRTAPDGKVWIATGGSTSNIYYSPNYGHRWKVYQCPIIQGENSTGPFSIAFFNNRKGIVVGGNYLKDKENTNNVLLTKNGGKSWFKPEKPVLGYRSAVEYVNEQLCFATGSSGTDVSTDGGKTWTNISTQNFNALQKAKKGSLVLLTGNRGQIYQLIYR
ncbi:WD40/YVTN/BNR-like repeat-containing protein [Pedobacter sp. ASV12]|uniref:WD40/YVTN/BNR-like repeat-containing protein n=1 Tax=Pedobacter sp. ASV12 TaxID=2795120 RepID=UPI001E32A8F8|nr:oxidoreductase [Pedobacter sp. ASV12]